MTDNRFKDFPIDARFPSPGVDFRFAELGVDARFRDGLDTRFQGDTYGAFNPRTLFGPTDTGWVYDLSDMSTLFQDAAGTTPVTAFGQPMGLCLDKSGRGNHRSQSVSLNRPTYARHPLGGIRNLLTRTEEFDNAAWVKNELTVVSSDDVPSQGPTTAFLLRPTTTSTGNHTVTQALSAAGTVTQSVYAKASGYNFFGVTFDNSAAKSVRFNLSTGSVATAGASATGSIVSVGNGWYRVSVTTTLGASSVVWYPLPIDAYGVFSGNGTSGTIIAGAQLELGSTATPYQRVGSVFDVTEAGVPDLYYLSYDGINDSLSTAPFAWGTDKATVVAGVRKLSDAAVGIVLETSATAISNNGVILLRAPRALTPGYGFGSKGTVFAEGQVNAGFAAPISNVLTGIADISGDRATLRINGAQVAQSTADQGTGNFGTHPVFFGARGGTDLFFKGWEYSNVGISRLLTTGELAALESWTAGKVGNTL